MRNSTYSEPKSNAGKPREIAKRLGQVFTPAKIADQMVSELLSIVGEWNGAIVVDPCVGEAALPKALKRAVQTGYILKSFDIDPKIALIGDNWIKQNIAKANKVICDDFLKVDNDNIGIWDVVIANPPYIRQEWIDDKLDYQTSAKNKYNISIPGAANLYVYFIIKLIMGLREEGAFSIIVYDSWSHTRYGRWLVEFLNANCNEVKSIPVRNTPFEGHLIDATILVGKRSSKQNKNSTLKVIDRSVLRDFSGFTPLLSEYRTKRGLRLKQASFFMGNESDIISNGATLFVKKPSKLKGLSVKSNHKESALLIPMKGARCSKVIAELKRRMESAQKEPEKNQSILNWLQKRPEYWERHPVAPKAPILFNYYFRNRPRHIYNPESIEYADNYYGVTPTNGLTNAAAFALLNSTSVVMELQECSRRQGNGLQKLQLFEYREAWVPSASIFGVEQIGQLEIFGKQLAGETAINYGIISQIDKVIYEASGYCHELEPGKIGAKAISYWSSKE
jgi:adenine-specific DNA-methyltransferase